MEDVRRQLAAQEAAEEALSSWTPPPGTRGTPRRSWCGRPDPTSSSSRRSTDLPPGRALDLACGEGRNARWLAERGWQVTAMDFSPVAIEKGRRLAEQLPTTG